MCIGILPVTVSHCLATHAQTVKPSQALKHRRAKGLGKAQCEALHDADTVDHTAALLEDLPKSALILCLTFHLSSW